MEYEIKTTKKYDDDLDYYVRKKKYLNILDDAQTVVDELEAGNLVGDEIPNLKLESDGHTYKARAANTDTRQGKSNGYRIIYYVIKDDHEIYLLSIYSKKDDARVLSNKEIVALIAEYCM